MYHPWRSARYDRPHHKAEHSKINCYDTAYPKGQEMALKSLVTVLNNLAVHFTRETVKRQITPEI